MISFLKSMLLLTSVLVLFFFSYFHIKKTPMPGPFPVTPPITFEATSTSQKELVKIAPSATTTQSPKTTLPPVAKSTSLPSSIQKNIPATPVIKAATTPAATPVALPTSPVDVEALNTTVRASTVNILCTTAAGYFQPISGSGVIIDTRGVILTNAHVGQFFLLKDFPTPGNISCVIRTGSPAQPLYTAELFYLPPSWIAANASQIKAPEEVGTGEDDYAFLRITGRTDGSPLPSSFPALTLTTDEPIQNSTVILAAYPAQFLGGVSIQTNLYASSAVSTVHALYTFSTAQTIDSISVGTTVVSQSGSSGGAVMRAQDPALEAIIAAATSGTSTSERDLKATTLSHIDRSLQQHGQGGIISLLTGDLSQKSATFNALIAPSLTQKLLDALK